MIKINLVREGRAAVRGAAAPGGGGAAQTAGQGPGNLNNMIVLGLLALGVVLAAGYWFLKHRELSNKQDLIVTKRAEAQKLEAIIKEVEDFQRRKDSLEKRILLINNLKKNQKGPVRLLDRVSQDLPDLVWLDRMTLAGNAVNVDGRALNPNAVANFVENIKRDSMFEEPEVSNVTQETASGNVAVYRYGMAFNFKLPPVDAGTPEGGPAGTAGATATTAPGN